MLKNIRRVGEGFTHIPVNSIFYVPGMEINKVPHHDKMGGGNVLEKTSVPRKRGTNKEGERKM